MADRFCDVQFYNQFLWGIHSLQTRVVYKIPCACQNTLYVGETWRLFQTRKKEHMGKVRLTIEDLHKGNTISAEKWMGKEDGALARHTTECQSDVDWGNTEIVARENSDYNREKFLKELRHYDRDITE